MSQKKRSRGMELKLFLHQNLRMCLQKFAHIFDLSIISVCVCLSFSVWVCVMFALQGLRWNITCDQCSVKAIWHAQVPLSKEMQQDRWNFICLQAGVQKYDHERSWNTAHGFITLQDNIL